MDLLTMKYPGKAQDIEFNRANGYTDDEIEAEYQARFQVNLFNGYSEQEIETAYGITPETKKMWREATRQAGYEALANAFDLTKKQVVDTHVLANGLGINPSTFLADRQLYEKARKMLDASEETKPIVDPPRSMRDAARAVMTGERNQYAEQALTFSDNMLYPTARLLSSFERMGYGVLAIPYQVTATAGNLLQDLGIVDKDNSVVKEWNDYAEYLKHPEKHGVISPWVAGKQERRRAESYTQSFMAGLFSDVGDAVIDFMGLAMSMNVVNAVTAGSLSPLAGASTLGNIYKTAKMQGTMGFLTTPGDMEERLRAGAYRVAYNLTPYVANAFTSGYRAVATDFLLNSFLTMPTYLDAFKNSRNPEEFLSMAIPQAVIDLGMAWNTRGSPETHRRAVINRQVDEFAKAAGIPKEDARLFVENDWARADEVMGRAFWEGTSPEVIREGDVKYDRYTGEKYEITSVRPGSVFARLVGTGRKESRETILEFGKDYLLNEPPKPSAIRALDFPLKHVVDIGGEVRAIGDDFKARKGRLLKTQTKDGKNKTILLQEVLKDSSLTPEDRAEVRQLMRDPVDMHLTIDDVRRLPITDAAVRLGFAGVKVAPIDYEDVPLAKILRSKDQAVKGPALELVKELAKNADMGEDIAWEQRSSNMWILSEYDLKVRSTATQGMRNMMNEAVRENPDLKDALSSADLKSLNLVSLGEMTLGRIRELNAILSENAEKGRAILRERRAAEQERIDSDAMKLRGTLKADPGDGKPVLRKGDLPSAKKNRGALQGAKNLYKMSLTPSRLFDLLDGYKNFKGFWSKLFYGETNKREDEAKYHMQNRRSYVMKVLRDSNLTTKSLADMRTVGTGDDEVTLTRSEAIGVYAHSLVPHQKKGIIDLNGLSERQIDLIVSSLSDGEKAVAHAIIKDFADNFDRIDQAFIRYANVGMDYVPNYTPIYWLFRTGASGSFIDAEKENQLQMVQAANHLKRQYARNGFTKTRVEEYPENMRGAIDLNLFSVWNRALQVHEHFAAYADHIRHLRRVLDWRGADNISNLEHLTNEYGTPMREILESYVNRIADPTFYKADVATNTLNRWIKGLRQNVAVAYLSYNLLTMAKQLPSLAFYAGEAGPHQLLASLGRALIPGEFRKMRKLTETLDPQINERGLDRSIEELRLEWEGKDTIRGRIARFGMKGITAMDRIAVTIGWNAVYESYMAKGASQEEAMQKAQFVTLQTQPASHPKDIPHLYATNNEILNLFLQFTNQMNKIWNITTHDLYTQAKNGDYSTPLVSVVALTLSAAMIHALSGGWNEDETFGDFLSQAAGAQFGNSLPVFGRDIVGYFQGYRGGELATSKAARNIFKGFEDALKGEVTEQTAWRLWEAMSVMWLGMPVVGPRRMAQFGETGDPAKLLGLGKTKKKPTFNF